MMYATKSLPPPATPPPEHNGIPREAGLYWNGTPVSEGSRSIPASLARPNPSVSNCGLVIVQVDRRQREEDSPTGGSHEEMTYIQDHRGHHWNSQSLLMPLTQNINTAATHQLIHGQPPITLVHDESDDGYRTHSSSSSSCSDGNSPQSQMSSESPPPGVTSAPHPLTVEMKPCIINGRPRHGEGVMVGEEGNNLMWLLDFKLDFFNDAEAKEKERYLSGAIATNEMLLQQHQQASLAASALGQVFHTQQTQVHPQLSESEEGHHQMQEHAEVVEGVDESHLDQTSKQQQDLEGTAQLSDMPKEFDKRFRKPPYTYTELITQALKDQQALTVSGIYNWITDRYPYFKAEDDRWKNSVRHNLSMNPHFRKGNKSKQGAGHLWVLADFDEEQDDRQQLLSTSNPCEEDDEAARAVRSILGQTEQKVTEEPQEKELYLTPELMAAEEANKENAGKIQASRRLTLQKSTDSLVKGLKRQSPDDVQYLTSEKLGAPDVFVTTDVHNTAGLPPPSKRSLLVDENGHITLEHHSGQIVIHTTQASGAVPFSPMEQMEELDVVASYCYEDEVASLEKALGIDLQDGGSNANQRELMAK